MNKKNTAGSIPIPDFKLDCRATVIKAAELDTKAATELSGAGQRRTQIEVHTTTKTPKIHTGEKTASSTNGAA